MAYFNSCVMKSSIDTGYTGSNRCFDMNTDTTTIIIESCYMQMDIMSAICRYDNDIATENYSVVTEGIGDIFVKIKNAIVSLFKKVINFFRNLISHLIGVKKSNANTIDRLTSELNNISKGKNLRESFYALTENTYTGESCTVDLDTQMVTAHNFPEFSDDFDMGQVGIVLNNLSRFNNDAIRDFNTIINLYRTAPTDSLISANYHSEFDASSWSFRIFEGTPFISRYDDITIMQDFHDAIGVDIRYDYPRDSSVNNTLSSAVNTTVQRWMGIRYINKTFNINDIVKALNEYKRLDDTIIAPIQKHHKTLQSECNKTIDAIEKAYKYLDSNEMKAKFFDEKRTVTDIEQDNYVHTKMVVHSIYRDLTWSLTSATSIVNSTITGYNKCKSAMMRVAQEAIYIIRTSGR